MRAIAFFVALCFLLTAGFLVTALPVYAASDIKVVSMTVDPETPAVGTNTIITVTIKNNDSDGVNASTVLRYISYNFPNFSLSGIVYPQPSGDALAASETATYTITGSFSKAGATKLTFSFDPANQLAESTETNNIIEKTISVLASEEDLQVAGITVSPASPAVGQDCIVTVTVKNNGIRTLNSSAGVTNFSYSFQNFSLTKATHPVFNLSNTVAAGATYEHVFEGRFTTPGSAKLTFTADATDKLFENSETNNTATANVTVLDVEAVDLVISDVAVDVAEPVVSEPVIITLTVKNIGSSALTSDYGLTDYDVVAAFEGFSIGTTARSTLPTLADPLGPNETFTITYTGGFGRVGKNLLAATVNSKGRLSETDTANNTATTTVTAYMSAASRDNFIISSPRVEGVSSSSVVVLWETESATTGKVTSGVGSDTALATTPSGTTHAAALTGLVAGNFYSYRVVATKGTVSKEAFVDFMVPADDSVRFTTNPKAVVNPAQQSVIVSWQSAPRTTATLFYKHDDDEAYRKARSGTAALAHSIEIAPEANGRYTYYVVATAVPGTTATSTTNSFIVAYATAAPDDDTIANDSAGATDNSESATATTKIKTPATRQATTDSVVAVRNNTLYGSLRGNIILKVESNGEAYYVNPVSQKAHYLGRPDDAFRVMREQGTGVTSADLVKIAIGLTTTNGTDTDGDGLSDLLEDALGTDKNNTDTDNDGYDDRTEVANGYSPLTGGRLPLNVSFANEQRGRILLQVQEHGEAWYVSPADGKRYFLGRPADAFAVMRGFGLGISDSDFNSL